MMKSILCLCLMLATVSLSEGNAMLPYMMMMNNNNNNNNNNAYPNNQPLENVFPNKVLSPQSPSGYNGNNLGRCVHNNPYRVPCGQGRRIFRSQCLQMGCCWDSSMITSRPRCYSKTAMSPNPYAPATPRSTQLYNNPTPPPQQPYGQPQQGSQVQQTVPPLRPTIPPQQNNVVPSNTYLPQQNQDVCKVNNDEPVIICGTQGISKVDCEAQGCCYGEVFQTPGLCYNKRNVQTGNANLQQGNVIPKRPVFTTPSTKTTTEMNIIDLLKKMEAEYREKKENKNNPKPAGSILDILKGGSKPANLPHSNVQPKTAAPPSRRPLTMAYNTPYTTPAPITRWQCYYGKCGWVRVPQRQQQCYPRDCGIPREIPGPNSNFDPRKIVGGSRAYPFSQPWTVMIEKIEGSDKFICGATLICKRWLLTAAHCLDRQGSYKNTPDLDPNMYKIYVGRYSGFTLQHGRQVQIFKGTQGIERMIQHENFEPGKHRGVITHDIALIKLARDVQMGRYSQPACLPPKPPVVDTIMYAAGWGVSKGKGPQPTSLKQVGTMILTKSNCTEKVPGFGNPQGVICAGGEYGHDTCTGDSGGPLLHGRELVRGRKKWYVYGLTSIGSPSCNTLRYDTQPAVYTDVFHYLPWIHKNTNFCCA